MTSQVAASQEVTQSVVGSPVLVTDQALQEQVEQKLQELVDLLESNGETFLAKWDPSKSAHSAFHNPKLPPRLGYLLAGLSQVQGLLGEEDYYPLLHGFLQWYMTDALEVLSPK